LGITTGHRDETSKQTVAIKIITTVQKLSFGKVEDQNHADHIFEKQVVVHKKICA
jgi:hypothetical protein